MHATIQKPIEEIVGYLEPDERVFVVACDRMKKRFGKDMVIE